MKKITQKDFLRAVRHADPRYFAEINERAADPKRFAAARKGSGQLMKQKEQKPRRIKRFALIAGLAAAVLGTGGIAAAVAMRGRDSYLNNNSDKMQDEIEQVKAPQLHLTDEENDPAAVPQQFWGIQWAAPAETEDGWYWYGSKDAFRVIPMQDENGSTWDDISHYNGYYFKSKETGETVPLCARPNCLHDGDEFCEATSSLYNNHNYLTLFDGKLCSVAAKGVEDGEEGCSVAVLSYAPDGTGIEELASLDLPYSYCTAGVYCVYRGCIFAVVGIDDGIDSVNELGKPAYIRRNGYTIIAYDPQSGKISRLFTSMPGEGESGVSKVPCYLFGIGDDLYFAQGRINGGGNDPSTVGKDGIHRIDLLTGQETCLIESQLGQVAASRSKLLYISLDKIDSEMYLYDPATEEKKRVMRSEVPNTNWNYFRMDEEHVYVETWRLDDRKYPSGYGVIICDLDLHPVSEVWMDPDYCGNICALSLVDGKIVIGAEPYTAEEQEQMEAEGKYTLSSRAAVFTCPIADALAGSGRFTPILTVSEQILTPATEEEIAAYYKAHGLDAEEGGGAE